MPRRHIRRNRRRNRRRMGRKTSGNPRARRTKQLSSPGTTILSGVRSLIGMIPGVNALKNIADFGFKAITAVAGLAHEQIELELLTGNVLGGSVFGLQACIYPTIAACIRDSPLLTRVDAGHVNTNFYDGHIRRFTVTIEPSNVIAKRSGSWALLFTPYRDSGDHKRYKSEMHDTSPTINQLLRHPGVVTDRADRPLTLSFSPRPEDGYIGLYVPISEPFGMICVAYQDENRTGYETFTADEFSSRVRVGATVTLRSSTVASTSVSVDAKFPDSTQSNQVAIVDKNYEVRNYAVDIESRNKGVLIRSVECETMVN